MLNEHQYSVAEDIHHIIYLLKYLIKFSIKSQKDTDKKKDNSAKQLQYYTSIIIIFFSCKIQAVIMLTENHVVNVI